MDRRSFWQHFANMPADRRLAALETARGRLQPGDLNVPFCHGRSPLGFAVARGDQHVAALLLELGADPDCTDMVGRTPLHVAISRGAPALSALLLDHGADVHAPDASLRTPLMYALLHNDVALTERLIAAGARTTDLDVDGRTVHDYAAQPRKGKDHHALGQLLGKQQWRRKRAPCPPALAVPEFRRFRTYQGYLSAPVRSLLYAILAAFLVGAGGYGNFFLLSFALPGQMVGAPFSVGPFDLAVFGSGPGLAIFAALCAGAFVLCARSELGSTGRREAICCAPAPSGDVARLADAGARDVCHLLRHGSVALLESTLPTVAAEAAPLTNADLLRIAHGVCLAVGAILFAGTCAALGAIYVAMYLDVRFGRFPGLSWLDALTVTSLLAVLVAAVLLGLGLLARYISLSEVTLRQRERDATAQRFLARVEEAAPDRNTPFALYLRSFQFDRALHLNGGDFESTLVYSIGRSLEVVALGWPGNLGAARVTSTDSGWRADFEQLSGGASVIFLIPGPSDGTLWEIGALHEHGAFERTVFIMPPKTRIGGRRMSDIWTDLLRHPQMSGYEFPAYRSDGAVFTLNGDGTIRSWGPIGIQMLPLPTLLHLGGPDTASSSPSDQNDDLSEEIDGEAGVLELDPLSGIAGGGDGADGGGGGE